MVVSFLVARKLSHTYVVFLDAIHPKRPTVTVLNSYAVKFPPLALYTTDSSRTDAEERVPLVCLWTILRLLPWITNHKFYKYSTLRPTPWAILISTPALRFTAFVLSIPSLVSSNQLELVRYSSLIITSVNVYPGLQSMIPDHSHASCFAVLIALRECIASG